jgi:hypothetical protein
VSLGPGLWGYHRAALALTVQAEATRKLWANPLSIYAPDPTHLAVVEFNASLREYRREVRRGLDALFEKLSTLRGGNA